MARERLIIVGGVVAGTAAALEAAHRRDDLEILVLERAGFVSYVAGSIPYGLGSTDQSLEALVRATPDEFRGHPHVTVRTRHDVLAIRPAEQQVVVKDLDKDTVSELDYDRLILATGSRPRASDVRGCENERVFTPRQLEEAVRLRRFIDERAPKTAIVCGAGKSGLVFAESLHRLGLSVTLLEGSAHVLPDFDMGVSSAAAAQAHDLSITVKCGARVESFADEADDVVVYTKDGGAHRADLAVLATGLEAVTDLAREAGLQRGATGAIEVDHHLHTSVPNIWACGECAEAYHRIARRHVFHPSPSVALHQGAVAGANAAGAHLRFGGIVGTAALRFGALEIARTGLTPDAARAQGLDAVAAVATQASTGTGGAAASTITIVVTAERRTGRLLGAELCGEGPVAKRIDVFATALAAEMTVDEIAGLDLAYAPPLSPLTDPILVGAAAARDRAVPLRRLESDDAVEAFEPEA
jgi:NADPH-dependent 2,4-dienoyl-CoA reductase/sulfur reductase-like enzyme